MADQRDGRRQRMRRKGFAAAVALVAGAAFAAPSAAAGPRDGCPVDDRPVELRFSARAAEPLEHRGRSVAELSAMRSSAAARRLSTGGRGDRLGLTLTDMAAKAKTSYQTYTRPDGRVCAYVRILDVLVGYSSVRVFVASELTPGTCAYRVVRAHEYEHVRLGRQALNEVGPRIRERLRAMLTGINPMLVPAGQSVQAWLDVRLEQRVEETLDELGARHRELNATIDTPANYRYTGGLCNDWPLAR